MKVDLDIIYTNIVVADGVETFQLKHLTTFKR